GGVGSIAIQLAKLAGLIVIATASRPETRDWVAHLDADYIVDHRQPLLPQLKEIGMPLVDFIANFHDTDAYWTAMETLIRPQGKIVGIVGNQSALDLNVLKNKSATFVWEYMFTRAMYQTPDMAQQGQLLNQVATYIDSQRLRTTLRTTFSPINAANLRQAHAQLEGGRTIGKLALCGWD
ncbi:MAG TPA: zinc-binding dehydrogenase, partial [Stenomitos sp.]